MFQTFLFAFHTYFIIKLVIKMDISNNLKRFLEEKKYDNITATSIAKVLNISKKTLSNYVNGDAYIPLKHLNSIANYFDVSIDYILGLSKESFDFKHIDELDKVLIGKRLKGLRKNLNLSQTDLANVIGVNKSSISKYESGKNLILTIVLYTICKKYNISADYLLGRIDEPKNLK